VVSGLLALLLELSGIEQRVSEHIKWMTRGFCTSRKPPCDRELKHGHMGGREIDVNHWMNERESDGGWVFVMA